MNELTLLIHPAICWPFPSKKKYCNTRDFDEVDSFTYSFSVILHDLKESWWECQWRDSESVFCKGLFWHGCQEKSGWLYIVYAHPPTKNYLSQLSCHIIKGKEQSISFVSSHFWGDKAVRFPFCKKQNYYYFSSSLPLSLSPLSLGV